MEVDRKLPYYYNPILCFPSTQDYSGTEMATAVPYGAREAAADLLGVREILLPLVELQRPQWVCSDLCFCLSGCGTEETHVGSLSSRRNIGYGGGVCHHLSLPPGPNLGLPSLHPAPPLTFLVLLGWGSESGH